MIDRLVLGTAGLGMNYGISNQTGKPRFEEAYDILKSAYDQGIRCFDTAQAYGESEEILGKVFEQLGLRSKVKIYTKLASRIDLENAQLVRRSVEESLYKLKVERLEGLLLHDENGLLFWNKGLKEVLKDLVDQGIVNSLGVSFYTPSKAYEALDMEGIDFIQVPANILDHRFEDAGVFKKAQRCNKEVFVRSIFLQGLLLMSLDQVPQRLRGILPYLDQIEGLASDMKLTRREFVLEYAAQRWPGAYILFGAENKSQVKENLQAFSRKSKVNFEKELFKNVPENILNPVLWPKQSA